jgi:hypothetical protein
MKIRGTVSELETRQTPDGALKRFRLHPDEGRDSQVETRQEIDLKDGDLVDANGTVNSDLIFSADSVSVVSVPPPINVKVPWKWIMAGIAIAVIVTIVLAVIFSNAGKSNLRVLAVNCSRPVANASLQLSDSTGKVLKTEQTNAQGVCVFSSLKKNVYSVSQGGRSINVALDGKASQSATLNLTPPFVRCFQPPIIMQPKPGMLQMRPEMQFRQPPKVQ